MTEFPRKQGIAFTFWFAVIAAVGGVLVYAYVIIVLAGGFSYCVQILKDHFVALIGLPSAAVGAFLVVVFLQQTEAPIVVKMPGFVFQGAAGQVAMWLICFSVIAAAIKMCW